MDEKITRRDFVRTTAAVPTLSLAGESSAEAQAVAAGPAQPTTETDPRFTPLDLGPHFNARLEGVPAGRNAFWGIPFELHGEAQEHAVLRLGPSPAIRVQRKATYVCVCHVCERGADEERLPEERAGEVLANYVFAYEDGSDARIPIRRRFEIQEPGHPWGQLPFAARPHRKRAPRQLGDPLNSGYGWGNLQTVVGMEELPGSNLFVCALANPHPDKIVAELRLESAGRGEVSVCAATLFHEKEHPLLHVRLSRFRIALPAEAGNTPLREYTRRWRTAVDLGVVARSYVLAEFSGDGWLGAATPGLGDPRPARIPPSLYVEVTASPAATLVLEDTRADARYEFPLRRAYEGQVVEARRGGSRIELIHPHRAWLHVKVIDAEGKPAPARVRFLTPEGRYIPPYGHRTEVNAAWFQDYGADVQIGGANYAYVDGAFQVELPVGNVYVEATRGFEYQPLRQKLNIAAGQRELALPITRFTDLRRQGWVTADSHVHFLSPHTALLEARAEGLNLIHLLATQWGDLFTNVGDFTGEPLTTADGEAMVHVATENRQHLLGHLGLLAYKGDMVQPFTTAGADESYLGDPTWTSMAEYAEACRQREGLAISVHFPNPSAELPADIVLGKIDAVELRYDGGFDALSVRDWYKYLNCGYRLPAVGGTDKMGAYLAAGALRTYADLRGQPFSLGAWTKAVRAGRTFSSTGALLFLRADGRAPGDEIAVGPGGATVEVEADAQSFVPLHFLELIVNGRVVGRTAERAGSRTLKLKEKVKIEGPSWMAARCSASPESRASNGWPYLVAAHTSPIYFARAGEQQFSPEAAAYFLTLMEGGLVWLDTLATRPDPERFQRIRQVFLDAQQALRTRMRS